MILSQGISKLIKLVLDESQPVEATFAVSVAPLAKRGHKIH